MLEFGGRFSKKKRKKRTCFFHQNGKLCRAVSIECPELFHLPKILIMRQVSQGYINKVPCRYHTNCKIDKISSPFFFCCSFFINWGCSLSWAKPNHKHNLGWAHLDSGWARAWTLKIEHVTKSGHVQVQVQVQ